VGLIHGMLKALFPPLPEPLAEVRPGTTALVRGHVVPRDLLECPLTGARCVYYQYTVEQWRRSNVAGVGGDGFWEIAENDEAIAEFYVQDGGGRAIVAPQRARVERARGVAVTDIDLGRQDRRAHQLLIAPGDEIEVFARIGQVEDLFDEGRGYRTTPTRLILHAPEDGEIVIRVLTARAATSP
jgi:hypothetical protein